MDVSGLLEMRSRQQGMRWSRRHDWYVPVEPSASLQTIGIPGSCGTISLTTNPWHPRPLWNHQPHYKPLASQALWNHQPKYKPLVPQIPVARHQPHYKPLEPQVPVEPSALLNTHSTPGLRGTISLTTKPLAPKVPLEPPALLQTLRTPGHHGVISLITNP